MPDGQYGNHAVLGGASGVTPQKQSLSPRRLRTGAIYDARGNASRLKHRADGAPRQASRFSMRYEEVYCDGPRYA